MVKTNGERGVGVKVPRRFLRFGKLQSPFLATKPTCPIKGKPVTQTSGVGELGY